MPDASQVLKNHNLLFPQFILPPKNRSAPFQLALRHRTHAQMEQTRVLDVGSALGQPSRVELALYACAELRGLVKGPR
jgi:hypothetical protein